MAISGYALFLVSVGLRHWNENNIEIYEIQ